jgi:hypothetical protein
VALNFNVDSSFFEVYLQIILQKEVIGAVENQHDYHGIGVKSQDEIFSN